MAWINLLWIADLLRFFRLFRHGNWNGADARVQIAGELSRSISRDELYRLLATLAHFALYVDQGISLRPARRKPRLAHSLLCEPLHLLFTFWFVAWCVMELCDLGFIPRPGIGRRSRILVKVAEGVSALCKRRDHLPFNYH